MNSKTTLYTTLTFSLLIWPFIAVYLISAFFPPAGDFAWHYGLGYIYVLNTLPVQSTALKTTWIVSLTTSTVVAIYAITREGRESFSWSRVANSVVIVTAIASILFAILVM